MNSVNLIGRIANEMELRYIATGKPVARFTLAINRAYSKEKKLEETLKDNPTADFISIVAWGKLAQLIEKHSGKGKLVGINGRLQSGSYENKENIKIYTTEVIANSIDILEWSDKDGREEE